MFCADLRTDSDIYFIHHKVTGFCNRGGGSTGEAAVCDVSLFIAICVTFQRESKRTSSKVSPRANAISKCTFAAAVVA